MRHVFEALQTEQTEKNQRQMNTKIFIAGIFGAITYLIQGIAFGFLFLNDAYAKFTNAGLSKGLDVDLRLIVIASLLISFLFVYVFSNWRNGINGKKGAIAGAFIFILAGGAFDTATLASTNLYSSGLIILYSAVGSLIAGAAVGGVIGWWLGRQKPSNDIVK